MKNRIRKVILLTISTVLRFLPKKNDECILLSSHIPIQNLGDQALLAGSIEGLKSYKKIHVIQTGSDSPEKAVDSLKIDREKLIFVKRFYIAFAAENALKELIGFLIYVSRFNCCFAIGADVLDGTYNKSEVSVFFDIINLIAKCNVCVTVVGSSFSKNISNETLKGISSLDRRVRFYCRDLYSLQRIERFFPARLSADAAFLMNPSELINAYGDHQKLRYLKHNRSVIGICLKEDDLPNQRSFQEFCVMLSTLKLGNLSPVYVCLPHHPKDFDSCYRIKKSMTNSAMFFMPAYLPAANEIKSMVEYCDIVVTGRMHVAIAALSVSAIPVCYSYGDKFSGLLKHFELENMDLIVGEGEEDIKSILLRCHGQKNELKKVISRQREEVLRKAKLNFISFC